MRERDSDGWRRRALLLLASAALASETAAASPITVVVRDAATRRPVADASVTLDAVALPARTDAKGEAALEAPAGLGRATLRVEAYGYELLEQVLAGGASREPRIELELRPSPVRLHEAVAVTAEREASPTLDVPRSVSLVEPGDLARRMPRTTPEALVGTTGVYVQKTNHGGGSPIIRGLVGNHVLVLVDGIRLNNSTFRYGPNQYLATVDPFGIERLEVVRGLGSVPYGSDALGGVVNVLTPRPSFSPGGARVSGQLRPKLASSEMERGARVDFEASGPNVAFLGGYGYRDFGDLVAGRGIGVQAPSGYVEQGTDGQLALRLSPRHLLRAVYQQVRQDDVPRFDQVAQRGYARYAFDPQLRRLAYLQLESSFDSRLVESLKLTPSFHRSDERRVSQRRGTSVEVREHDVVDTLGFGVEARSRPRPNLTIVSGLEAYRDDVSSTREDLELETGLAAPKRGLYADGARSSSLGLFVQGSLGWRALSIDLGGRLTRFGVDAADASFGEVSLRHTAAVGTAAVMWKLGAGSRLYGAVSQGFRAPNVDDVSTLGRFDFGVEAPSTELEPERSTSYELGFKSGGSRVATALALYRTNLADLIERVPAEYQGSAFYEGQRVYRRSNVGLAYVWGAEAELQARLARDVLAFGSATYTYGQQVTAGEPMRRIPPLFGRVGIRLEPPRGLSLGATVLLAGRQDRLASGDKADHRIDPNGTPGYGVLDLHAGYGFGRALELRAGMDNVFDEAYRVHGSGVDGPGRYFWIGAAVRF